MHVFLIDRNKEMILEWINQFGSSRKDVNIIQGDLFCMKSHAIVSPANSFGFMDGGVDYIISNRLGWHIQEELKDIINRTAERELLVGNAIVIETGNKGWPYLISAPTMRVPMDFNIKYSVNAYLAMKAALIKAVNHPNIKSVSITGLCTGVGNMSCSISAKQMFIAYKEVILGEIPVFNDFGDAMEYQLQLNDQSKIFE